MNQPHRMDTSRTFGPTVNQGKENNLFISFNPDDSRFYVSKNENGTNVLGTFAGNQKGFANAIQFARKH